MPAGDPNIQSPSRNFHLGVHKFPHLTCPPTSPFPPLCSTVHWMSTSKCGAVPGSIPKFRTCLRDWGHSLLLGCASASHASCWSRLHPCQRGVPLRTLPPPGPRVPSPPEPALPTPAGRKLPEDGRGRAPSAGPALSRWEGASAQPCPILPFTPHFTWDLHTWARTWGPGAMRGLCWLVLYPCAERGGLP